jgi:hypothetical protein
MFLPELVNNSMCNERSLRKNGVEVGHDTEGKKTLTVLRNRIPDYPCESVEAIDALKNCPQCVKGFKKNISSENPRGSAGKPSSPREVAKGRSSIIV